MYAGLWLTFWATLYAYCSVLLFTTDYNFLYCIYYSFGLDTGVRLLLFFSL